MASKIFLNKAKQGKIISGHPWVFPHAIQTCPAQLEVGDWVEVYSAENTFIGSGFYNPNSLYRVRMISYTQKNWQAAIEERLLNAFKLRENLGFPNQKTTAYRLLNSEADGLSGLVMDVLGQVIVIASSAFWVESKRAFIMEKVQSYFPKHRLVWLSQTKPLTQDGYQDIQREAYENLESIVLEEGIQLAIDFSNVQKTGIYIDQRENHARVAQLCKNKKVLDLYTYHGGFALHAAKAGAKEVLAIDSSEPAIIHAKRNAKLNELSQIQFEVGDAKDYLDKSGDYDVVILDPPKLIPSKRHLHQAKNLYRYLHRQLFRQMRSGSILMTCNCSSAISPSEFVELVSNMASAEQKHIQILGTYGPAICHPILPVFPEGQYLTAVLVCIM